MHPSNPYANKKPDFEQLATKYPSFAPFVTTSSEGFSNIDWKDVGAVRALNYALLKEDWQLEVEMMEDRLCPPVPNRLDYLYHLLDIDKYGPGRKDEPLRIIDIGTGAMAIYPLLLHRLRPNSKVIATEKNAESLAHALKVVKANGIGASSISVLSVVEDAGILFPLLDDPSLQVDFTMCNPPFFSSDEEMQQGAELKADEPHAAASGAAHELVTDGGEVAFIGQMIKESLTIRQRCTWCTSLIGRYASLALLVAQLKREKIDNYYIIPSQPAKTVRWILVWSHTPYRLPDTVFRSPGISATLLPPPNTQQYVFRPHRSSTELREAIIPFLDKVQIEHNSIPPSSTHSKSNNDYTPQSTIEIRARGNTWSRAARRKLQLQQASSASQDSGQIPPVSLKAALRFLDGTIEMDWTYGSDRADIDSLWKSMLANSGLVDRASGRAPAQEATSQKRPAEVDEGARKELKASEAEPT